ncbi:hypothetical protein BXZ70DRAFT_1012050 [Cristinia sonorae]|uniref:Uncharacterized protein n=1 Tax=Cristinia sonorae TaxID=1940300 RepID=A0A8K0UG17_9AGAR|nr:hypothetical protein BXZ70DRAFT_1012050 [Cristinia sonorae]
MFPQIPPELNDRIIDHLHDDVCSLSACGLTSRAWLPSVRYHRFGSTVVTVPRLAAFRSLIDNTPEIGTFVQGFTLGTHFPGFHRVLPADDSLLPAILTALPYVNDIQVVSFTWNTRFQAFSQAYPALQHLTFVNCMFPTELAHGFPLFLATFPFLRSLSLQNPSFSHPGRNWEWDETVPRPPLTDLCLTRVPGTAALCHWLRSASQESTIKSFTTNVGEVWKAEQALHVFRCFGHSIRTLDLTLDSYSGLAAIFEEAQFSIEGCTGLHVLHLELHLHGMCVKTNSDLRWISVILSQISSPNIHTITFSLCADPMSDYRGLDSECAVRPLQVASFTNLIEFDWEDIHTARMKDPQPALVVKGQGLSDSLRSHLEALGLLPLWSQSYQFNTSY